VLRQRTLHNSLYHADSTARQQRARRGSSEIKKCVRVRRARHRRLHPAHPESESHSRGKVAIGPAADRSFAQFPSQLARNGEPPCRKVRRCLECAPWAGVDSTADFNPALAVERMQLCISYRFRPRPSCGNTHVHLRCSCAGTTFVRAPRSRFPHSGQPIFQIREARDLFDLPRHSTIAFTRVQNPVCVRRLADHSDLIISHTFARRFHRAMGTVGRLGYKHRADFLPALCDGARRTCCDFSSETSRTVTDVAASRAPCFRPFQRPPIASASGQCPTSYRARPSISCRRRFGKALPPACPADKPCRSDPATELACRQPCPEST